MRSHRLQLRRLHLQPARYLLLALAPTYDMPPPLSLIPARQQSSPTPHAHIISHIMTAEQTARDCGHHMYHRTVKLPQRADDHKVKRIVWRACTLHPAQILVGDRADIESYRDYRQRLRPHTRHPSRQSPHPACRDRARVETPRHLLVQPEVACREAGIPIIHNGSIAIRAIRAAVALHHTRRPLLPLMSRKTCSTLATSTVDHPIHRTSICRTFSSMQYTIRTPYIARV
jgi:hypothetical protein